MQVAFKLRKLPVQSDGKRESHALGIDSNTDPEGAAVGVMSAWREDKKAKDGGRNLSLARLYSRIHWMTINRLSYGTVDLGR